VLLCVSGLRERISRGLLIDDPMPRLSSRTLNAILSHNDLLDWREARKVRWETEIGWMLS
jgi:hypothetical protein